jgi:hypothetical protein
MNHGTSPPDHRSGELSCQLRSTICATRPRRTARRGASILEIGEVLGHKSPQSTRRYSHLSVAHTRTVLGGMVAEAFPIDVPRGGPDAEAA